MCVSAYNSIYPNLLSFMILLFINIYMQFSFSPPLFSPHKMLLFYIQHNLAASDRCLENARIIQTRPATYAQHHHHPQQQIVYQPNIEG